MRRILPWLSVVCTFAIVAFCFPVFTGEFIWYLKGGEHRMGLASIEITQQLMEAKQITIPEGVAWDRDVAWAIHGSMRDLINQNKEGYGSSAMYAILLR